MEKSGKPVKKEKLSINKFLYYTHIPVFALIARIKYGLRVDSSKIDRKGGPYLVLGNHTSPIDFIFFAISLFPRPLNFVAASNMYYRGIYAWYLRHFRTIPKRQFSADFTCIKLIRKFLDSGTSVMLFPEGRVTVDGTTGYISPTIGKLVKWLGYPVLSGITEGAYVGNAKWGKHKRSGKVSLEMQQILSKEDISKMSASEISDFIISKLQYNDNQRLIDRGGRVVGFRIAEGLEKILYKCPKCGAEFQHTTKLKKMTCNHCGNTVVYKNNGEIVPFGEEDKCFRLINEWYKWQRDCLAQEIDEDENFILSDRVTYMLNNAEIRKFTKMGDGVLKVSKEGVIYEGNGENDGGRLAFKIANHPSLAFKMGEDLEVSEDENIYRFVFTDGLYSTKYVLAVEELSKKYFSSDDGAK